MRFDRVAILDWSSASKPKKGKDSIWIGTTSQHVTDAENFATRALASTHLETIITEAIERNERLLLGVDFSLGFPHGFGATLTGSQEPFAIWAWLEDHISDDPSNQHNLREVASEANQHFPNEGPFWGNASKVDVPGLPRKKPIYDGALSEFRATEQTAQAEGLNPKSCWQLAGAGAVGAQSLVGIAMLQSLRKKFGKALNIWPYDTGGTQVTVAEVYPAMLSKDVSALCARTKMVPDEAQVRLLSQALWRLSDQGKLENLFHVTDSATKREGWILGLGHQIALRAALPAALSPPRLQNDCFAMPQGVDWVPVSDAQARLRNILHPMVEVESCDVATAAGRILAKTCVAQRSNPPLANSAVDGYGFVHAATGSGPQRLPLVEGRAAAGQPFQGQVPHGAALRILTGASLPEGVDTVVLEEDTQTDDAAIVFDGPVKPYANTRKAGEDVCAGASVLSEGHKLRAPDIALLSALGVAQVQVYRPLRVGVLSTGDEIVPSPSARALPHQIWDANRPMLLSMVKGWGYQSVDLGHVRDDPESIAQCLNQGAAKADVLLTSGGASAGDEDHVSALLRQSGTLSSWRIALKPGRPLALALWEGTPVFGLPGNPVAAFVCALIFAYPALSLMAGAGWSELQGFVVPAAFEKNKKAGRREYLRARLNTDGYAEVFHSEGSGRISGLSWATGLVELPDEVCEIRKGTAVRFLPFTGLV